MTSEIVAVGYAHGNCPSEQVTVLCDWPGEKHRAEGKYPTKIAYAAENKLARDHCGYEVQSKYISYAWFKLCLDKNTETTDFDRPHLGQAVGWNLMRLPENKTVVEVITDFLRFLYFCDTAPLAKLGKSMFGATPVKIVLCIAS